MTTRYVSAAELVSRVPGPPGYRFAVIGHPVCSASDRELAPMARATVGPARDMPRPG